ncbi:GGDEF domain-containing protein [Vibrio cholerae]|uniref:GGDEF domain-containing protein n=1 Tax=Vibrio cholerae TaxID=666 RepID=UPI000B48EDD1|nr:GGDEF domain-containing protein [Vibrio cholerae]
MNTQTQKTLHPLILHAKTLLIFMSAILILANLYLINSTRDLSKSYSSHTNQAIWFLFQLNKEFTEMLALSPYLLESESNQRDVMVKYELTWSRFDLILNSPEADGIIGMPSTREFFQAAFARFKQLEPLLLAAKNPESLQTFIVAAQQELEIFIQFINRTAMFAELERHRRSGGFSLFLLDLNGFKQINDTYGHQMGDAVLKQVAYRLNNSIPSFDYRVFRMGGDEFAIILSSINSTEQMMMQRMIKQCFDHEFELSGDLRAKLNTSVGVSTYPLDSTNLSQLIHLADKNMYEMKFLQKSPSS